MIASVHIADAGLTRTLRILARPPKPASVTGLRHADVAIAAPLRRSSIPRPQPGRVALFACWDDDDSLDHFLADHPVARALGAGWHARLEPMRAWGTWPGLPSDLSRSRAVAGDGPVAVLTLARTRLSQLRRFLATSRTAERRASEAPGLVWGTALARPPFFATCSLWADAQAAATYAYGPDEPAHPDAIAADRAKPFHHRSAFVRFRPYASHGGLAGANPLPEGWMARV
jgi:hypothetical protein